MKYGFSKNIKNGVVYLSVPSFDETGLCTTCFTTRLGGVSAPPLNSMNLSFGRGDSRENVLENYRILGNAADVPTEKTVSFSQVHKNDVCIATSLDAGEAFLPKKREFDAIVTQERGLPIATYHADCTPIFLLDTKLRVCAAVHSGWRGTAEKCAENAVLAMKTHFGSEPRNILAGIGPCIRKCCFETKGEVPEAMLASFGEAAKQYISNNGDGSYNVSLDGLCAETLRECGIPDDNITLSGECTSCKCDTYWSHRKTGGIRGSMMALICLK